MALSADHPGETIAVPLQNGQAVDVVEHRFLAGSTGVNYQWESAGVWFQTGSGDDTELHYPLGATMDLFQALQGPGLLLLHAPGNTFMRDLAPGERILIQPSSLIWKDRSVDMRLHFEVPAGAYWFNSPRRQGKTVWLACHGPGRIAVQSVFERPEHVGAITGGSMYTSHWWDADTIATAIAYARQRAPAQPGGQQWAPLQGPQNGPPSQPNQQWAPPGPPNGSNQQWAPPAGPGSSFSG